MLKYDKRRPFGGEWEDFWKTVFCSPDSSMNPDVSMNSTDMRSAAAPFLRLDNRHITGIRTDSRTRAHSDTHRDGEDLRYGFSSLSELGLYAMLGAILSNPSFTSASGGLYHLLLARCKNRYFSLSGTLRRLRKDGYLLRTRIPGGKNCFRDYYTLSHTGRFPKGALAEELPSESTSCAEEDSGICHLTYAEGQRFLSAYQPFQPPCDNFTMISIPMLYDARLSLGAKGLYAVIARQIRLSVYNGDVVLSKDALRKLCPCGDNAFDRLFRELRKTGYLRLTRTADMTTGRGYYLYSLSEYGDRNPALQSSVVSAAGQEQEQTGKLMAQTEAGKPENSLSVLPDTAHQATPVHTHKYEQIHTPTYTRAEILEKFDFDCLKKEYPAAQLDCIAQLLTGFLCGDSTPETVIPETVTPKNGGKYPKKRRREMSGTTKSPAAGSCGTVSIGGEVLLREQVAERLWELDSEEIRYVLDTYHTVSAKQEIRCVPAYLLTCLYHAKENLALALDAFSARVPGLGTDPVMG